MMSLWLSQGTAVQLGAIGPMILGSTSVALYALLVGALALRWGLGAASGGAWALCLVGVAIPAVLFLRHVGRHHVRVAPTPAAPIALTPRV